MGTMLDSDQPRLLGLDGMDTPSTCVAWKVRRKLGIKGGYPIQISRDRFLLLADAGVT